MGRPLQVAIEMTSSTSACKIYDLSHPLNNNTLAYPGDPHYTAKRFATIADDGCETHSISLCSHTGTHIDAPSHFIQGGLTVDQIPLSKLVGPAVLIDLSNNIKPKQKITWEDIVPYAKELKPGVIVLICTGWYEKWGTKEYYDHPFLMKDVAQEFVSRGVRTIAVDFLNPDETVLKGETEHGFIFHGIVLGAGGFIVENMTNMKSLIGLSNLHVSLLPLKLEGIDGSPIRAIAWQMG
jgi:kynurenine formamidase